MTIECDLQDVVLDKELGLWLLFLNQKGVSNEFDPTSITFVSHVGLASLQNTAFLRFLISLIAYQPFLIDILDLILEV